MNDFSMSVIAEAVDYLVANHDRGPDLDTLARRAGYEVTYFQKIFKEHVGISPKRLLQYMSMNRARDLLHGGATTLEAAMGAGLSGQGRLHDLTLGIDGMTPGEVAQRGQGLSIVYGFHPTPIGDMLVARTEKGVCYLGFRVDGARDAPLSRMKAHFPHAVFANDDAAVAATADRIMRIWRGKEKGDRLGLDLHGTNLQIQVWQALLRIPAGQTVSYRDIAEGLGRPRAARAIGNAVGANPVSLLIPCHRVIQASGIVNNYGWGSPRKKMLLAMEAGREA